MKRVLLAALLCFSLSGCSGKAYREIREIESFEIIQTVGVDYADGMYTITAATGTSAEGEVTVLTTKAVTIARAMRQMQNYSAKKYIFFGHAANYLIGEGAAADMNACLEYVEQGFDMRLDTNIYVVRGGNAGDAIAKASEEGGSINEHLLALEKDVQILSENHIFSCGDVAEELAEDGSAVVTAISLWENENVPVGEGKKSVRVVGYAVINDGSLVGYADMDASRAITLMMGNFSTDSAELPDGAGSYAAVELRKGAVEYDAEFDGSKLRKIKINAKLQGNIAEMETNIDIYDPAILAEMERVLAKKEIDRMIDVIELCRRLDTDIIELRRKLSMKHPVKMDKAELEPSWISEAEIEISAEVDIERTYELKEAMGREGK